MIAHIKQSLYTVSLFMSAEFFSQQQVTGIVTDNGKSNINPVLVINVSNQKSTISDASGRFSIEASENDEIRFVKEGYYRFDKKMTKEDFNSSLMITLEKREIEIPEVKITYKPTGNLEKDNKHLNESRKIVSLRSELGEYMKSPLNEPLPNNSVSKTFNSHDHTSGQLKEMESLYKKIIGPKTTKANFTETQDFIKKVKQEVDLTFLEKYGMDEERIDQFLLYANDTRMMAKKYRKNFKIDVVEDELRVAFAEYNKTRKLDNL